MGAPRLAVTVALGIAAAATFTPWAAAAPRLTSTCAEDDQTPTPPGYAGWERSSVVAWQALEDRGGIVPDIEEDRSHAPPAWWRYPSPLRSSELLAAEARNPKGLYEAVAPADLQAGDVVVRVRGAGACGKMAFVAGRSDDQQWVTIEDGEKEAQATRTGNPTFFLEGKSLRPEVSRLPDPGEERHHARARARAGTRSHPPRADDCRAAAAGRSQGRAAVDDKVNDLVDEAGSLAADPAFEIERRALLGRALALAAALDWPGATAAAAAVLEDAIHRTPNARRYRDRARQPLPAGGRERQGPQPGRGGQGDTRSAAAPALRPRAGAAGDRKDERRAGRAQALPGRRARGRAGPQAGRQRRAYPGPRRAARAPRRSDRRAVEADRDARARHPAQHGLRLQHRVARHLARRRHPVGARDRHPGAAGDGARGARGRRGRARHGDAAGAAARRRGGGRAGQEGGAHPVPRGEAEDAAAADSRQPP